MYDSETKEIGYSTVTTTQGKTFVIDHPIKSDKYLVHACLEGPEAGVYYRGKCEIINDEFVNITLPEYAEKIATDFTIQITPLYKNKNSTYNFCTTDVIDNRFTIHGQNGKYFWTVYGKRLDIITEPNKIDSYVKGSGPYKWLE
jgi:hypothetical protein